MTKRGFNSLIEQEYIDILIAFGKQVGAVDKDGNVNKTEAFRKAMEWIKVSCLVTAQNLFPDLAPTVADTPSGDPTPKSASTVNKRKGDSGKKLGV